MPEHGVWSELTVGEMCYAKSGRQGVPMAFRRRLAARLRAVCDTFPPLPYEDLCNDLEGIPGDGGVGKHVDQERSLVAHALRAAPLASGGGRVWIDMGGGRGCLSERIMHATGGQDAHLLVDWSEMHRARIRDPALRRRTCFTRVVANVGDVDIEAEVAEMSGGSNANSMLVAVSKHLCGCATDLVMRQVPSRCRLLMAPCCHHLCKWESYQGRGLLEGMGVTHDEFDALCAFAPWASIATGDADGTDEQSKVANHDIGEAWELPPIANLKERWCSTLADCDQSIDVESSSARRMLGQRCKLLLDAGRAHFLSQKYERVRFIRYTARSVEDRLIIAY